MNFKKVSDLLYKVFGLDIKKKSKCPKETQKKMDWGRKGTARKMRRIRLSVKLIGSGGLAWPQTAGETCTVVVIDQ